MSEGVSCEPGLERVSEWFVNGFVWWMGWTRTIELGAMGHALHESGWLLYWRHPLSQANGKRGDERRHQVLGVPPSDFSSLVYGIRGTIGVQGTAWHTVR